MRGGDNARSEAAQLGYVIPAFPALRLRAQRQMSRMEAASGILSNNPGELPIAAIPLSALRLGLGLRAAVGGEGAADVVALLELPAGVAADVTLIGARVDQCPFRRGSLG